jgi:RNA-directed DNA polymerase
MRVSNDISWESVSWPLVKKRVFSLQCRIYEAKKIGNRRRLFFLQNVLINSLDAKLYSVLQVASFHQGRKTPVGAKTVATSGKEKMEIVNSLSLNGNAQPLRRVWIDKPAKPEKRPLGIPTIRDRAKQALVKLALEPEWEAVFEPNSYGFRPGRGSHDAVEALFKNLCHNIPKFVYDADIRQCFDTIDHTALLTKLDTFPRMKKQISAWLQAGVLEGYSNTSKEAEPTTQGTPQGGIVSPLLANIALHGLEEHLKGFVTTIPSKPLPSSSPIKPKGGNPERSSGSRGNESKRKALGVVRYADDIVLTHGNRQILELCIQETKKFLSSMSLSISEEKSKLRDCREGFSFLGFRIIQMKRKNKYSVKVYPTRKNQAGILLKLRLIVQKGKSLSSYDLIERLSPTLIGWARYYQYCECSEVFTRVQHLLFQKLRAWAFRRDRKHGRMAIKEKYFPSNKSYSYGGVVHKDNWIFVGQKSGAKLRPGPSGPSKSEIKTNFLPSISWIPSKKFVKVASTVSPFDGKYVYWANRSAKYSFSKGLRPQVGASLPTSPYGANRPPVGKGLRPQIGTRSD